MDIYSLVIRIVIVAAITIVPNLVIYFGTLAVSKDKTRDLFYRKCYDLMILYSGILTVLLSTYILFEPELSRIFPIL